MEALGAALLVTIILVLVIVVAMLILAPTFKEIQLSNNQRAIEVEQQRTQRVRMQEQTAQVTWIVILAIFGAIALVGLVGGLGYLLIMALGMLLSHREFIMERRASLPAPSIQNNYYLSASNRGDAWRKVAESGYRVDAPDALVVVRKDGAK